MNGELCLFGPEKPLATLIWHQWKTDIMQHWIHSLHQNRHNAALNPFPTSKQTECSTQSIPFTDLNKRECQYTKVLKIAQSQNCVEFKGTKKICIKSALFWHNVCLFDVAWIFSPRWNDHLGNVITFHFTTCKKQFITVHSYKFFTAKSLFYWLQSSMLYLLPSSNALHQKLWKSQFLNRIVVF